LSIAIGDPLNVVNLHNYTAVRIVIARLQSILRMCGLCLHFCFGLDPLQLYNMKYAAMH
jgi:hypothetical protein